jgi:Tfp pilus assembly protein PilN
MSTANPMSFLPENYLANKAKRRTNFICASLFIIVIVAIGSALALATRSLHIIEQHHTVVQRQYTEAAKRIEQVKLLQEKQQIMSRQAELAASLLERVPRSNLLAEITNALPTGVSLVDLSMDSKVRPKPAEPVLTPNELRKAQKEPKGPEPKLYDVTIKLTGVAGDDVEVAQFIRNLSSSKLLQDVNLVVVNEAKMGSDPVRKFQLRMMINPAADLQAEGLK